jgi:hypothetical protein
MAEIALNLKDLTRNQKKALARSIKAGLTGNATFPSPSPTTTELENGAKAVEDAEAAVATAAAALADARLGLRTADDALDTLLTNSATNAMDTTRVEAELRSANYPIKGPGAPVGILDAPLNVHVSDGDTNFSADVQWDRRRQSTAYIAEIAEDENGPYVQKYAGTQSRCTIPGLDPTKLYYVRVCTMSSAGMGRWSAPVPFRVR